jgi:uncharacterized damage-inducible protein DinB
MPMNLNFTELLDYTDWERQKWRAWLRKQGDQVLKISAGPHGDGRFQTVGEIIRHVFSAEKRYVDRLSGRPLSDTGTIPADNAEALFQFGEQSRKDLRQFLETFPAQNWDIQNEFQIQSFFLRATPRKIMTHVVLHEIRHWAQVATLFRLNGLTDEFHDFLFSPILGGEFGRKTEEASA